MPRKFPTWAARHLASTQSARAYAGRNAGVVQTIRDEAKAAGATLARDGEGGLDPELALKTFRAAKYTCEVPGCKTAKEKVDLDHIGGHPHELEEDPKAAAWLKKAAEGGKKNTPDGLHVLCSRHHDMVHQRERALDNGNNPPEMST
jgi:hypothetical protein